MSLKKSNEMSLKKSNEMSSKKASFEVISAPKDVNANVESEEGDEGAEEVTEETTLFVDEASGSSDLYSSTYSSTQSSSDPIAPLQAEPSLIDFELVPIYESATREVSITNFSDAQLEIGLVTCHEQWLREFRPELVSVEPSWFVIEAQETITVTITVRPTRANIMNFYIVYEIYKVDGSEIDAESKDGSILGGSLNSRASSSLNLNENDNDVYVHENDYRSFHLLDFTFIGDHAIFKVTDISLLARHPIWDAQQSWNLFSIDSLNHALLPYHHTAREGEMPEVPRISFRFPPGAIESETAVFQITFSNTSDLKGYWEIYPRPPESWQAFQAEQRAAEEASAFAGTPYVPKERRFTDHVVAFDGTITDNEEMLCVLWGGKFDCRTFLPDNKKYPTVRPELRSRRCTSNDFEDFDVFDILPRKKLKGCLEGTGAQQVITFKYKYKRLGHQQMSVLLRVYPAIFVWIDMTGQTLSKSEPYLEIMHEGVMKMHPVSCANMDPPIQTCWLCNGGNIPIGFVVDMKPFEQMRYQNFGHKVVEMLTTEGTVPPRSCYGLKLRFSPIEYTEYAVALRVLPEYLEEPLEVILKGSPVFTTSLCLRPDSFSTEIRSFTMHDEGVPVRLTPSMISFNHFIPTGHSATTVVFLTNCNPDNGIRFKWPRVPIEGGGCIRFQPDMGIIPPNEEVGIRVTVEAGRASTTFSQTVRVYFEDDGEVVDYNYKHEMWKREKDKDRLMDLWRDKSLIRGLEAFDDFVMETPDGREIKEEMEACKNQPEPIVRRRADPPEPPSGFSRLLAVSAYIGSVFGLYDVLTTREKSRMCAPQPISVSRPIPQDPELHAGFILSKFEQNLSESLISNILGDIFQSQNFSGFLREATKRNAPTYEDYRRSEMEREEKSGGLIDQSPPLLRHSLEEMLESTMYNLIQEMGTNYLDPVSGPQKWLQLAVVQPKALLKPNQLKAVLKEQHWDYFENSDV